MAQDTGIFLCSNSDDRDVASPNAREGFPWPLSWERTETITMQLGDMRNLRELLQVTNMIVGTLEQLHRQSALNEMGPHFERAKKSLAEVNAFLKRDPG